MTGIIVLCRYSSTRLPGKILRKIQGKALLEFILERLQQLQEHYPIVVCTSEDQTDDVIAEFCNNMKVEIFRGSLDNVALRFMNCAEYFKMDKAVRINGDNLFLDSELIEKMIVEAENDDLCFFSNVKERTFPKGMSIEIADMAYYRTSYPRFNEEDKEHVMTYFYRQVNTCTRYMLNPHLEMAGSNFAIDTEKDLAHANSIVKSMEKEHIEYGYREIFDLYQKVNSDV